MDLGSSKSGHFGGPFFDRFWTVLNRFWQNREIQVRLHRGFETFPPGLIRALKNPCPKMGSLGGPRGPGTQGPGVPGPLDPWIWGPRDPYLDRSRDTQIGQNHNDAPMSESGFESIPDPELINSGSSQTPGPMSRDPCPETESLRSTDQIHP